MPGIISNFRESKRNPSKPLILCSDIYLSKKEAYKIVKGIDPIFNAMKLNPNDVKVLFHPIDFVVFNGKTDNFVTEIILLDKKNKSGQDLSIQKSIEKVIQKKNFDWLTLRVGNNGNIIEE